MITLFKELNDFLINHLSDINIKKPLPGLRVYLGNGYPDNNPDYFENVISKACKTFENYFNSDDTIYLLIVEYKYKKRRIHANNYIFKQITGLKKENVTYSKIKNLYSNDKDDVFNRALLKTKVQNINYRNIFKAISYTDFPLGMPESRKEIHFINIDKKVALHMYDDRGMDIFTI